MAQKACCRSLAPSWEGAPASAWCTYCSAMDTSGDPGNKISSLQHSKQCKRTFFFPHRWTGVPVWPRAQIAGPRRCSQHSLSSCWQDQERNTEVWWESSVAWERFSLFYEWNSSTDIHVSHDYDMPFRLKDATKTHYKKITVPLFTDEGFKLSYCHVFFWLYCGNKKSMTSC